MASSHEFSAPDSLRTLRSQLQSKPEEHRLLRRDTPEIPQLPQPSSSIRALLHGVVRRSSLHRARRLQIPNTDG